MSDLVSGSKIFITGATGFVGSHLTEALLSRGAEISVLINDFQLESLFHRKGLLYGVHPIVGCLTNFSFLKDFFIKNQFDTVIHLAAVATENVAFENPHLAFEVNIHGTYNLLEACHRNQKQLKRMIVASSDKAYGDSDNLPYCEDSPLAGRNPYDVSKSCADLIALSYYHSYQMPLMIGRYGNIFGPGDFNFSRLIPGTLRRLYQGDSPIVKVHPDGPFYRDFLYIKDVVRSYLAMFHGLSNSKYWGQAYNFSISERYSVEEIIKQLQSIVGREMRPVTRVPISHREIRIQELSNEKAKQHLSWTPECGMNEALGETADWYFRHFDSTGEGSSHSENRARAERYAAH